VSDIAAAIYVLAGAVILHPLLTVGPSLTEVERQLRTISERLSDIRYRLPKEPNK
jgi:hypothetical protein